MFWSIKIENSLLITEYFFQCFQFAFFWCVLEGGAGARRAGFLWAPACEWHWHHDLSLHFAICGPVLRWQLSNGIKGILMSSLNPEARLHSCLPLSKINGHRFQIAFRRLHFPFSGAWTACWHVQHQHVCWTHQRTVKSREDFVNASPEPSCWK